MRWLAAAVLLLAALPCARAADESELKAAIVYNLLTFVEWPADAAPPLGPTLVLCVQPDSRYATPLKLLAEQGVRGRRIQVRETALAEAASSCHALLLEDIAPARLAALARSLRGSSMLVIADAVAAAQEGIVVSLQRVGPKVLFDVNLGAARQARLQLSSKLIRLAREVIE